MPGSVPDVLNTLRTLVANYFNIAWPFVFLHVIVLAVFVLHIQKIFQEGNALHRWTSGTFEPQGDCARILQQFVDESRHWGPRGIFVPMTDFSDRLDSFVGGRLDTLHSHVNLFLVIGVAGTFFAMFRFAVSAAMGDLTSSNLSLRLAQGLSHAFPVGFMGLILSVAGHFVASAVEDRYRKAVNDATQHAMTIRQETGQSMLDRLEAFLAPLQNLQQILAGSLQPVIEGFQQQLKDTSALIQGQIQPLASAVAAIGASVEALSEPARNLAVAASGLPEALAETARLQQENRQLLERTTTIVNESSGALHRAALSMQQAAAGLHDLPESLRSSFESQLGRMASESERLWNEAAQDLFAALSPACDSLAASAHSLQDTSTALNSVPSKLAEELRSAVSSLSALHTRQLTDFSNRSFEAWQEVCRKFVNRMNEATSEFCNGVRAETERTATALGDAGREVQNLVNGVSHHLESSVAELYRLSLEELRPHLQRIDEAVASRYPAALESLTAACNGLKELERLSKQIAPEMESIQAALKRAAEDFRQASLRRDTLPSADLTAIRSEVERLANRLTAPRLGLLRGFIDRLRGRSDSGNGG